MNTSRRHFLTSSGIIGVAMSLEACKSSSADAEMRSVAVGSIDAGPEIQDADDVTAVEDLMREHGVLRRALVVYREMAALLRTNAAGVPPDALQKTAKLFRSFGEDYHERKLEEAFIFPAVKKAGGAAANAVDILQAQHQRGREQTGYILAATQAPRIGANAMVLANVLETFARMYEEHTAIEDTLIFPAWKKSVSPKELDALGDKFEDIEKQTFGKDGFDDAVEQMSAIETTLGLSDLSKFTAPPPPKT
jgi:hemerythrin-like domain-containing protein